MGRDDILFCDAGVVELADTPDLGSGAARRGGSSPLARTIFLDGLGELRISDWIA